MHADGSHNDKPGFFSKIFGHGDDSVQPESTDNAATTSAQPSDPALSPPASDPIIPTPPVQLPEPDLQSASMSDVHSVSAGPNEPLDLSSSAINPVEPVAETFELPQIQPTENTPDSQVPVIQPTDDEGISPSEEVVFDSTQPSAQTDPGATPETSAEAISPEQTPTDLAPEATAQAADTAPAEVESNVEDATPATVAPPAPPVEEGKAWSESQASLPTPPEESSQAELESAQSDVNTILSDHRDLTTDEKSDDQPASIEESTVVEPIPVVSPLEKETPVPISPPNEAEGPRPEREAAVVRLKNHIDDLEAGLQKVRDELDALKG